MKRENIPTKLGEYTIEHLRKLGDEALQSLSTISSDNETFFPIASGNIEVAHCTSCKYTERLELAKFSKQAGATRTLSGTGKSPLPVEKVSTPDCNTIDSLANFLNIPTEKTAKALMYTRVSDGRFVFVVVRGDMQLSEEKLKQHVGDIRTATDEEIISAGATPGYASAVGLKDEALIVVDDLIPQSQNLVAGANEPGYHLKNTNYGRDYSAEIVVDLIQVQDADACINCGNQLSTIDVISLTNNFQNTLLALAESHHDDYGLTLPYPAAPFDVYLMHIPGKELDTQTKAEEIYKELQDAGISVLFDDRDDRAGVKFNDADLIGPPIRVTVGERGLKEGMVELKPRKDKDKQLVPVDNIVGKISSNLQ
ncbi:MAG TPA: His/Gly/Thr/Pro-type tRNA ligase C-terminal domain-containing protein [Anaerolineales bacterium]|nr:His/Gly/Thr/Pro-type tRNA ligase C-terminal domain-containing protein [Anaerolineales bacterium]